MKYRDFGKTGERVSALGFGCMRFPLSDPDNNASIIEDEAISMLRHAIDNGVNYVDTAFFYHDGASEGLVGKALKEGYREKVLFATKSPFGGFKNAEDFRRHLDIQLERLQVETIDCYLFHCIMRSNWQSSALAHNLIAEMERAKAEGKIRYIGFSFHDDHEFFKEICDYYDWDFCQIQLNYIDVENQAGLAGLEYAAAKGMAVIVMEPLLGGRLANPTENVKNALPQGISPVKTALDFIWNRPEVCMLLSGMSTMKQVEDNLKYAGESAVNCLEADTLKMLTEAKKIFDNTAFVSCTACEYCMPCPFGVEIPSIFKQYNRSIHSGRNAKEEYAKITGKAEQCEQCGACESVCPQHIEIIRELKAAGEKLA